MFRFHTPIPAPYGVPPTSPCLTPYSASQEASEASVNASFSEFHTLNPEFRIVGDLNRRARYLSQIRPELLRSTSDTSSLDSDIRLCNSYDLAFRARLVDKRIISPPLRSAARQFLDRRGRNRTQLRLSLGLPPSPPVSSSLSAFAHAYFAVKKAGLNVARKADLMARLTDECNIAHRQGWFIIFNTLTVSDEHMDQVFAVGSRAFTDYIRSFYRRVGVALGIPKDVADRSHSDFHRYFAVVEHGGKNGRLHVHILHFCKALPRGCQDPNGLLSLPKRTEIDNLKPLWSSFGWSTPIMVRYSADDAFSRLGWKWPLRKVKGVWSPLPAGDIGRVANYVGKYIAKQTEVKKWKTTEGTKIQCWRTRMNRGFGTEWIRRRLSPLPARLLMTALVENKSRNPSRTLSAAAPSWRRLRRVILSELSARNLLRDAFLISRPRTLSALMRLPKKRFPLSMDPTSCPTSSGRSPRDADKIISDFLAGASFRDAMPSALQASVDSAIASVSDFVGVQAFAMPVSASFCRS